MESGIVGGKETLPHTRPYMVSVQHNGNHQCGGILIREDFVLTAAHCLQTTVDDANRNNLEVVLGAHNIEKKERCQQRIQVKQYLMHPNYRKFKRAGNWKNLTVDIMLLKAGMKCDIAGWGMRNPKGLASDVLIETKFKLLPQKKCNATWQMYYFPDCMMCTASETNNAFCQGDSGGPLICDSILHGMAIYTHPDTCNNRDFPGVYLNISAFLDWIKKTMGKKV